MSKEKLYKDRLQLDIFSSSYLRFEEDFYKYSRLDIPLPFLLDELLLAMALSQKNYFRLHKEQSRDGRDHYYYFKVRMSGSREEIRVFEYRGTSTEKKSTT